MDSYSIERVSATDLADFGNLTHLDLDRNRIRYLEDGCFDSNIRLSNLKLSYNMIEHFPISLGPLISRLRILTLAGSIAPNISNFDLRPLRRMYWIGLRENDFEEMVIDIMSLMPSATNSLEFYNCSMHQFPDYNMYIPAIKDTMLTNNYFAELSFNDFRNLSKLEILTLGRNNLTTMPDLYDHSRLTNLFLEENPLVCDRALCWIVMWSHTKTPALISDTATCQNATDLQGVRLTDLHPLSISCYAGKWYYCCPNACLITDINYICVEVRAWMMVIFV